MPPLQLKQRPMRAKHETTPCARILVGASALVACITPSHAAGESDASRPPLMIQQQGNFAVGGTMIRSPGAYDPDRPGPEGQTLHGDHARVFYQVPVVARKLPVVMWPCFSPEACPSVVRRRASHAPVDPIDVGITHTTRGRVEAAVRLRLLDIG